MLYSLLAGLVLAVHLAFVLFAALGGLLVLRWRKTAWLHLPAVAWATFVELSGGICPLTPPENSFRRAAGEGGYEGGFIEHHLVSILYPDNLTRATQFVLAAVLVLLNLFVYALACRRSLVKPAPPRQDSWS